MEYEVKLNDGERLEPLDDKHYIIQSENGYRFGSDAVDLAKFAARYATEKSRVVDMCSGSGIIGILLSIEKGCTVDGVELDDALYDMSVRSARFNGLNGVAFYNADVKRIEDILAPAAYDVVVCNPPFYKAESRPSKVAPNANSELTVALGDIVRAAKYVLKVGGSLCMVHTATRMDEVLSVYREYGLTPKELVINKNCKTFLLRAVRGGKDGLTVNILE
ncbi:MAG: methyltransferase [Clostridiales bacterium]|nr:methyltransferase [Clostridiales bacterium]